MSTVGWAVSQSQWIIASRSKAALSLEGLRLPRSAAAATTTWKAVTNEQLAAVAAASAGAGKKRGVTAWLLRLTCACSRVNTTTHT